MKRDMNLVRKLLLYLEDALDNNPIRSTDIAIDGYSDAQIGYHLSILADRGLIDVIDTTSKESKTYSCFVKSVTWQGHDYLNSEMARSSENNPAGITNGSVAKREGRTVRVFLSYSHEDRAFVEKLATDLEANEIGVWYDDWDVDIGDVITTEIQKGLSESHYLTLVLSPAAIQSAWVQEEWATKLSQEISQGEVIVLPILYRERAVPLLLQDKKHCDFTNEANYKDSFQDLLRRLRGESKRPKTVEKPERTSVSAREEGSRDVEEFFSRASFGKVSGVQIRAAACPVSIRQFKGAMSQKKFRDACTPENQAGPRPGEWAWFSDGLRFASALQGNVFGRQYEVRFFHNGAVCFNFDASKRTESGVLLLKRLCAALQSSFLECAAAAFERGQLLTASRDSD
ncbi:MAG: TIR domain-containing protein [Candidatus Marsarchaeota archaeon]|nr:TIR domain-containing protein [Candidatus Marsarchaeota archaeon]